MSESPPPIPPQRPEDFPPSVRALGQAIRAYPGVPDVAFCGLRLYMAVLGTGRVTPKGFLGDGSPAAGDEPPTTLVVSFLAIAGRTVVSFDPTLPPDGFRLAP